MTDIIVIQILSGLGGIAAGVVIILIQWRIKDGYWLWESTK